MFTHSPALLEQMFDVLTDHVFLMQVESDGGYRLTFCNLAMSRFFAVAREDILQKRLEALLPDPELYQRVCDSYRRVLATGKAQDYEETSEGLPQAPPTTFHTSLAPLFDAAGHCTHICGVSRNITARKQAEDALRVTNQELEVRLAEIRVLQVQLQQQAIRDELTGLYNRRYLEESLERELQRAERAGQPLTLMMIDVDHFKAVNDTYGHQAGDRVLQAVAELLRKRLRAQDIVCRFGGEEFVVILPDTAAQQTLVRLESWFRKEGLLTVGHEGQRIDVQFSMGLAEYPTHGRSGEQLLRVADRALYQAKHNGRNQVCLGGAA
ncbi:MAG: GGDEF domain-containing protein [Marinobacter sp.]|nr:GGDEF domain-containing protein [Marinobacter sp.]